MAPLLRILDHVGDMAAFSVSAVRGVARRTGTLGAVMIAVGYSSVPVILVTGTFIGMVLAVQAYDQFAALGMATRLGVIINVSVVKELGPVLAGVMLAGRVGSAMAAELATMRVTDQVDALACLGTDPVHHLVSPRLVACVLLIPLLTILANFMGVVGGAFIVTRVYGVDPHFYWQNAQGQLGVWDLSTGLLKPTFFGAAIALISCHRGLNGDPGAEGVGRAATRAFVASFIAILALDFFLSLLLNNISRLLWVPRSPL
ncbi:MAG: ABC transporter permease [Gemmataceae bacterium]|nr:ABC transporter permease [Gemmataceae bacterium]